MFTALMIVVALFALLMIAVCAERAWSGSWFDFMIFSWALNSFGEIFAAALGAIFGSISDS